MPSIPWEDAEFARFVNEAVQKKTDVLKLAEKLAKSPFADLRGQILDYIALVPKFRKKFGTEALLACDKLALEQSTAADIGKFKALLFEKATSIDDLCCGMGGDSFFLSKEIPVRGIDLSEERVAMYRFNTRALGAPREGILADIRTLEKRNDFFTVDPARRAKDGDNQRNFSELTPTFAEVLELSKLYKGGMAKLPPGYPTEEFPADVEVIYLGAKNDCRECLVLFGQLAENPGKTRAISIDSAGNAHSWTSEDASSTAKELPVGELGAYIAEPIPVLVRSHLFAEVALREAPRARLISAGIAYATNEAPLDPNAFHNFRILGSTPISTGKVKKLLKEFDVGKLTLKKRGVEIVPEAEIKRLAPKGKREAILFYTRVAGEKTAILAESVISYF
ncbi:MAG: hypothetical protein J6Z31_06740 [Fibrobacter sp.]|nr:hypothetical protein [Fibrobacter sp.]